MRQLHDPVNQEFKTVKFVITCFEHCSNEVSLIKSMIGLMVFAKTLETPLKPHQLLAGEHF
jgi:hypothetical protein